MASANPTGGTPTFHSMNLDEALLKGIHAENFATPTAIQQRAIETILEGRDVVIQQAGRGEGKTATLAISVIQLLVQQGRSAAPALLLSPTEELGKSTSRLIASLSRYVKHPISVMTGTPPKILAKIENDKQARSIKMLFIDDANGNRFQKPIFSIYHLLAKETQVVSVCHELSPGINSIKSTIMTDPVVFLENLVLMYVNVGDKGKFDALNSLFETVTLHHRVIFCQTKKTVDWLAKKLREDNHVVVSMHGGMQQDVRQEAVEKFRQGESYELIATDSLSKGLGFEFVTHVINYDVPRSEVYFEMLSKTRRFQQKVVGINFVNSDHDIDLLHRRFSNQMEELDVYGKLT